MRGRWPEDWQSIAIRSPCDFLIGFRSPQPELLGQRVNSELRNPVTIVSIIVFRLFMLRHTGVDVLQIRLIEPLPLLRVLRFSRRPRSAQPGSS